MQALYEKSHPQYLNYIYLIAPVSVVILNPIGFLLLETQKRRENGLQESHHVSKSGTCALTLHVIKGVLTNPIVFMTVIGIIGNFVLNRHIPLVVMEILDVLGENLFYLKIAR